MQATATRSPHVRWLTRRDMPEILQIERTSGAPAWTERRFIATLRGRHCISFVVEIGDQVVGFLVYELRRERVRIRRLIVAADHRRQGIGRLLLERLRAVLRRHRRARLTASVAEDRLDVLRFLRAGGFRATALSRRPRGPDRIRLEWRDEPKAPA